ncbi:MAG: GNAT family N-acetyltransferase [Rubricella sp.]
MGKVRVTIHRVRRDDVQLLDRIGPDVFDDFIRADRLDRYLDLACHFLLVAVAREEVVGQLTAVVHHHPDVASELFIENIVICPKWRNKGIASRLLDTAIVEGRAQGAGPVWFVAQRSAEDLRHFFRNRHGFAEVEASAYILAAPEEVHERRPEAAPIEMLFRPA